MDHWFSLTTAKTTVVAVLVAWSQISYPICLIVGNTLLTTLVFCIKLFMNDCITHVILVLL